MKKIADLSDSDKELIVKMGSIEGIAEKSRTTAQQKYFKENADTLTESITELIEKSCKHELDNIRFVLGDEDFDMWMMDVINLRPPKYPNPAQTETINEAISQLYATLTTAYGVLIQTEPVLKQWLDYEKRIQARIKAILKIDKEWQANGLFETWYPTDVSYKVRRLAEVVSTYQLIIKKLNLAWEMISRQMTLYNDSPTEELSRKPLTVVTKKEPSSDMTTSKPRVRTFGDK